MKKNYSNTSTKLPLALAFLFLQGCAATIGQEGLEKRTSLAIGREIGKFTIQSKSEETGGRINYSVKTTDGATYQCYMYSATGFQKAMSFGQTPDSDAVCSLTSGKASSTLGSQGTCNALMKAAGKC